MTPENSMVDLVGDIEYGVDGSTEKIQKYVNNKGFMFKFKRIAIFRLTSATKHFDDHLLYVNLSISEPKQIEFKLDRSVASDFDVNDE